MYHQEHPPLALPSGAALPRETCHCGKQLSPDALQNLTRELLPLYARAFMHSEEALAEHALEFAQDLSQHLAASERITVVAVGEYRAVICGRTVSTPLGQLYHLEGVLVDPALQGHRFGYRLTSGELRATGAELLAFHTQSRIMLGLGSRLAELDPHLASAVAPYIQHHHLANGIDEKRYGGKALYGDPARLKELGIPGLDLSQGDALFTVGRVRKNVLEESL